MVLQSRYSIGQVVGSAVVLAWMVLVGVAAVSTMTNRYHVVPEQPAIYIVEIKPFKEFSGVDVLLVTYALSGAIQAVSFETIDELASFLSYLRKIGRVVVSVQSGAYL